MFTNMDKCKNSKVKKTVCKNYACYNIYIAFKTRKHYTIRG